MWSETEAVWGWACLTHTVLSYLAKADVFKVQRLDQRESRGGGPWGMVTQELKHSQPGNCGCLAGTWLQRWSLGTQNWCPS